MLDGGEYMLLFRLYLQLNRGIAVALAIITFIQAWNSFLGPFPSPSRTR